VVYSIFVHVDARLALNSIWDHGGHHGQESEEGKEEDRQEEKEVGLANTTLAETHQGARGFAIARLTLPRLDVVQRRNMQTDHDAQMR
jgi:hypothetical protein